MILNTYLGTWFFYELFGNSRTIKSWLRKAFSWSNPISFLSLRTKKPGIANEATPGSHTSCYFNCLLTRFQSQTSTIPPIAPAMTLNPASIHSQFPNRRSPSQVPSKATISEANQPFPPAFPVISVFMPHQTIKLTNTHTSQNIRHTPFQNDGNAYMRTIKIIVICYHHIENFRICSWVHA